MLAIWLQNLAALAVTAALVVVLLALLGAVERWASRIIAHRLGWRGVLLTGWLGVPLHELGHLVVAKLFGHRIIGWKLLDPDPTTGTLGYVRHAYRRRSFWQLSGNFFIGISPLVTGALALSALLAWAVGPEAAGIALSSLMTAELGSPTDIAAIPAGIDFLGRWSLGLLAEIWHERSWWLPLQVYLAACVTAHLSPSRRDLSDGALGGLAAAAAVLVAVTILSLFGVRLTGVIAILPPLAILVSAACALQAAYVGLILGLAAGRRARAGGQPLAFHWRS